jgi:hypothetical protein
MSGRFAKLKPGSDERQAFWDKNEETIRTLFEEINTDVFNGTGIYKEAKFHGNYDIDPPLTKPYLFISFPPKGSLSVCTANTTKLRVIVELFAGRMSWKSFECSPETLADVLEIYVKLLVG